MSNATWSDFPKLSAKEQRKFLEEIRPIAQLKHGIDEVMYNKYAQKFHMKKI